MKQLLTVGILLALGSIAIADDEDKEVKKHITTLKTSKSNAARLSAISDLGLLASIGDISPAVPVLIDVLKTDKNAQNRTAAATVLTNTGATAKDAVPVCIDIVKDEKEDTDLRAAA